MTTMKTEPKAAPKKGAAPKPAAKAAARTAKPAGAGAKAKAAPAAMVRLKDLVDRVTERSGAKKGEVRPVVEAALAVLGEALRAGESLSLPGLGKAKVSRQKDTKSGEMLVIRLRQGSGKADGAKSDDALADADE